MQDILLKKPGKKVILLGNEALVRAALEAGVQWVSTYPGTPASEIGNAFYQLQKERALSKTAPYFEFSVNEKVALEAAMGASFSGLRSLVAMKHFGLNVCSDSLIPFVYMGAKAACVIVAADDPSCHSSAQSEQDSRAFAFLAHIPILEPSDPQECKDFTQLAFETSERFRVPVLIRTTTRVSHQRAIVELGRVPSKRSFQARFVKDARKFITMPPRVLEMKKELFQKLKAIGDFSERSKINIIVNGKAAGSKRKTGVICSGVSFLYVLEALQGLSLQWPVLKLGFFHPLAEKKIKRFIKNLDEVLIVEELEPYLEREVARLAREANPRLKIWGKNVLAGVGELSPEKVLNVMVRLTKKKASLPQPLVQPSLAKRPARPCPGCPYWLTFAAVKRALKESGLSRKKVIFGGDIGCYMLAGNPTIGLQDYLGNMGSSLGIGHGIKKASSQKLIAFIGDSTFFHAGIPGLINTVFNHSNPLIIVMENLTTAMTGQQPHPGQIIKIEELVRACGIKNAKTLDPIDQKELISTIREFLEGEEVSVIVAKRPCIFVK